MKKPYLPYEEARVTSIDFDTHNETTSVLSGVNRHLVSGYVESSNTPNYKHLRRKALPQNPYRFENYVELRTGGSMRYALPAADRRGGWTGDLDSISWSYANDRVPFPRYDENYALSRARNNALSKIKNQRVNLGQAWAEREQLVKMLTKTVNRLASAVLAVKHGNFDHAFRLFGEKVRRPRMNVPIREHGNNLANYWLEYQFGWRPLVSDIYGSCELIADTYYRAKPSSVIGVFKERIPEKTFRKCNWQTPLGPGYTIAEDGRITHIASAKVYLEFLEDSSIRSALSTTGLSNPLNLAWELLPYSFLVDYLLKVGDYINLLDSTMGYTFLRGTESFRVSSSGSSKLVEPAIVASYNSFYHDNEVVWMEGMSKAYFASIKHRNILTSFPSPSLIRGSGLGVERTLNCISLITQAFARK